MNGLLTPSMIERPAAIRFAPGLAAEADGGRSAHAIRRMLDNNPRDISQAEILALCRAAY